MKKYYVIYAFAGMLAGPSALAGETAKEIGTIYKIAYPEKDSAVKKASQVDITAVSADLRSALPTISFQPSGNSRLKIRQTAEVVVRLVEELGKRELPKDGPEARQVASATKEALAKIESEIDENYQPQRVTANVKPPDGVPNATMGMTPDAIADPTLRAQYLGLIATEKAKADRNAQQAELREMRDDILRYVASLQSSEPGKGWQKSELLDRFSDEGESKKQLKTLLKL